MKKQDPDVFDSIEQDSAGDSTDGTYDAPEEPMAVQSYGTTIDEERRGESFDLRDRHTLPEVDELGIHEPTDAVGRLVQPGDEDVDDIDDETNTVAWGDSDDSDDLSAEEAAMHTTDL